MSLKIIPSDDNMKFAATAFPFDSLFRLQPHRTKLSDHFCVCLFNYLLVAV